ncbi:MAG TPA: TolC family protein [Candidatus Angelobacter sp.]|nr:TolC family protein [Candidatus Angelobacter sp.]
MSVIGIFREPKKCLALSLCMLLVVPMFAQQGGNPKPQQQATQNASVQTGAPGTSVPDIKPLPSPTSVDYSKAAPFFPNPFKIYTPRLVPLPTFTNTPRIEELMKDGKIMLSLNDAIGLALSDNLDLAIQRYNLPIADTDLLLTRAGGSPRGVNTGLVSGTPGGAGVGATGSQGSGAGGTSAGAGGAGAGASGLVLNTSGAGPQPDSFDPFLTSTLQLERSNSPSANTFITGGAANTLSNTFVADFTFSQGFVTGTETQLIFNNQRNANNFLSLRPQLSSNFRLTVRQHLLQGFGPGINGRFIVQAKNNKKITEEAFRLQVIVTVSQIQNLYWDLVNAYEDVKVKERSLALSQKTLSDNKKQVEIGTLAPIEIVRDQSTVAQNQQDLITSQTNLQLQQLLMKNAITRNLPNDSPIMQADMVPSDTIEVPQQDNLPPVQDLIRQALTDRPDYIEAKINLKNSEIGIKGANNGLLPTVDLLGFYGGSGLAGVPIDPITRVPVPANATGLGDVLTNTFNNTGPDKGVALSLSIPLRNRAAQAVQVRSQLEYRQAQLRIKQLENQIGITVRNDQFAVQQNRARVATAQQARELALQSLDAEQKKYALGASTYILVLQAQRDLAQAESNVVSAVTAYAKSRVALDQDTAQTLERNNISVQDAVLGQVKTQPAVPGLKPYNPAQDNPPAQPVKPPQ